jgi:hypothetical protein
MLVTRPVEFNPRIERFTSPKRQRGILAEGRDKPWYTATLRDNQDFKRTRIPTMHRTPGFVVGWLAVPILASMVLDTG